MYANQLTIGQYFTTPNSGDVWQRIPPNLDPSWERYPGIVAVNTNTGLFGGIGPLLETHLVDRPTNPRLELIEADVVKLVERDYEFGIGGIGMAHDPYYADTQYQPTGEKRLELSGPGPRRTYGQLWQECEHRGCHNEPVCSNCFMCQERHCHCNN
jgi:hypothetical protein